MKKLLLFIFISTMVSGMIYSIYYVNAKKNHQKEMLGKKIVVMKDTLLIIDYRNDSYILSNRTEINYDLAETLIINK